MDDNEFMEKQPTTFAETFKTADVRQLHALLGQRTTTAFWDVGDLLNARFVERAGYRMLDELSEVLGELGSDAPTSANQLQKCRTLRNVWSREDAAAADKVELPWSHAI